MSAPGIEAVLAAHQMVSTVTDACTCGAGDIDTLQPSGIAINRHRAHVADALRAHLLSEAVVERATGAYWHERQGVPVGAWQPPTDLRAMAAALTAATEGDA